MNRWIFASFVICCSFSSVAKDRQLVYDQDVDVYKLTWDDVRISEAKMREIAVLSPFVDFAPDYSIGISGETSPAGKVVRDKVFLAPQLELCLEMPGKPCTRNPDNPDALYLENAARNLQDTQDQLKKLRAEKVPRVLEPVRAYLLDSLQRSAEWEKFRYDYLKTGDARPLKKLLCRECACTTGDESLLERLATERDPTRRLQLSRTDWHNRVLECAKRRHPKTYPMEAWERFVRQFGIMESRTAKSID